MDYTSQSSQRYSDAGKIATKEGYRPGSHEWWNRIREVMARAF